MKVTPEEIKFIENTARTAALFHIDNIVIEPDRVRAIDDDRTIYLNLVENVPDLSFGSICITRVGLFLSRLEIAKVQKSFAVEAIMHKDGEFVQSLVLKGEGTKIEYLCGNPTTIKIPKDLNDERTSKVKLNGELILLMQKGMNAMSAEEITIISNGEVTFEMIDLNKDVLSYEFPDKAEAITKGGTTKFAHKYPVKHILSLFKQDPTGHFEIGGRIGTLSVNVNGINVYVIPQT